MRAITLTAYADDVEVLAEANIDEPKPGPRDVLVEVHAAGVNPFDCKMRKGTLSRFYPLSFPCVIGNDVAGVVVGKGPAVWEFNVGDRVYGMQQNLRSGSYAEFTAIDASLVRRMPENLSFVEAASIPMVYQTAWMGLVGFGRVNAGQFVLVHGAAGGVGSAAVQLAKAFGARVAATCRTDAVDFVGQLGADVVFDYTKTEFGSSLHNIDLTLDPIGGQVNLDSYRVMRRGGTILVVLREDPVEMQNRQRLGAEFGVRTSVIAFEALPDVLDFIRPLFEQGSLQPVVRKVLPLSQAREAHRIMDSGHARGKMVLAVRG